MANVPFFASSHYASLGAVGDFSDTLIFWAYERQRACDMENNPYYFECLTGIAMGRRSDMLNFEVAKARSEGAYTLTDVAGCYKSFNITPGVADEDLIIGVFRSRLSDAPRQEHQMRADLKTIGLALKSQKIVAVSEKSKPFSREYGLSKLIHRSINSGC